MRTTQFVESYFDAWNQMDVSSIAGFFARNGVYFDIPADEHYSGSELVGFLSEILADDSAKARYDLAGEILVGAEAVAFRYNSYDLDAPAGRVDPRPGSEFWLLTGDKVARVDDYYEPRSSQGPVVAAADRSSAAKYLKSGLCEATADRYRGRLVELMDKDKVYLQPDLSLPELARMVRCSVNHLSQVINADFQTSFFEFLNQRRIADAMELLAGDPKCYALDVALKVGFNSNSTFYSAFKKVCNMTPAQFRRQAHGL